MGNPPLRPDIQASIGVLFDLFLDFTRARSIDARLDLERKILAIFERLGATSDRSIDQARERFETLRTELPIQRIRPFEMSARNLTNARIRRFEKISGNPRLTGSARQMLRIPVIETAELTGHFDEAEVSKSLDRVLESLKDAPTSESEGGTRSRTSIAVIRAFYKNFCNIPPFCSGIDNG